jgi:predicted anti-sigma-YlaC factor YlaD
MLADALVLRHRRCKGLEGEAQRLVHTREEHLDRCGTGRGDFLRPNKRSKLAQCQLRPRDDELEKV